MNNHQIFLQKSSGGPQVKSVKEEKNLSPRNKKACHSINTALMQSVIKIGTKSTTKSSRKKVHEFSPHIPQKRRKGT
jgi:hypothetical protein